MQKENIARLLFIVGCAAIAVLIIMYSPAWFAQSAPAITDEYQKVAPTRSINPGAVLARALYAKNITSDETLLDLNAEAQLPLASVTKVMAAVVALRELPENARIEITPGPLSTEGESGLIVGEHWQRDNLVAFMLISSSNDAAAELADAVEKSTGKSFIALMNEEARALGLAQTFYMNPTGLDLGSTLAGAYGSAHDQTLLIAYAQKTYPDIFEKTTHKVERFQTDFASHLAANTDGALGLFPGLHASKTGLTDLAGGNLVLLYDLLPGVEISSAVLGSTESGRFKDSETIRDLVK